MLTKRNVLLGAGALALAPVLPPEAAEPTLEDLLGPENLARARADPEWSWLVDETGRLRVSEGFRAPFASFLCQPRLIDIRSDPGMRGHDIFAVHLFHRHGRLPPLLIFDFIEDRPSGSREPGEGLRLVPDGYVGPLPPPHQALAWA
ncbi:hypothetical protein CCR97_00315 [Rhodoplanes elegans]|uniref:Uncharacterized protein n=1 Tax=Rhodoplanes elegans TaxID=29408 RepID=A0A327KPD4_9BRAD|nr:hypothetical protein [Rhodoplanes elegans]MBK5956681.1 hypothetical protein [Rhodoplanes elegans]RAI39192.1 hypothetical protein CH338_10200 [Rhodoplanes elegans]